MLGLETRLVRQPGAGSSAQGKGRDNLTAGWSETSTGSCAVLGSGFTLCSASLAQVFRSVCSVLKLLACWRCSTWKRSVVVVMKVEGGGEEDPDLARDI